MPSAATTSEPPILCCGDDEFEVKRRARQVFDQWCREAGGLDHEIIDAAVGTVPEALRALARLREALQTLPFFGSNKVVWFKDCTFLGEERAASSAAVTAALADLLEELKGFSWTNVRLLLSAGKVDRRKSFFKTLEKLGRVELFTGLSFADKDWAETASLRVREGFRAQGKRIDEEALAEMVNAVGPNGRELAGEVEKVALYVGDHAEVTLADVTTVVSRRKHAEAFALGDALGDRDLPRLLRILDEELWTIRARTDKEKTVIGVLYGLVTKVRVLLMVKEMLAAGLLKPVASYGAFKSQWERLPEEAFPEDRRFNPRALNAYVLFKALPQAANYRSEELVKGMELLLDCNRRLVSSQLDESLVLQQALVALVGSTAQRPGSRSAPFRRGKT